MTAPGKMTALSLLLLVGCADPIPEGPICDGEILVRALEAAAPGDTVQVGACRVEMSLSVPAGVTLAGAGSADSILAPTDSVTVRVAGSTDPARVSTLRGLTIEASAVLGISADGPGGVNIEDVVIIGSLGYGMRALGLAELTLTNVTATGPVTAANSEDSAFTESGRAVPYTATATVGIGVYETERAVLRNVRVEGFAELGVGFLGVGQVDWMGGSASRNITVGIYADGANMMLDGVDVSETFTAGRGQSPIGIIAVDSADVGGLAILTTGLTMDGNGGIGLLQIGLAGAHVDLSATGNSNAPVWAASSTSLEIRGAASSIADNFFAGLFVADVETVAVSDVAIESTREAMMIVPGGGALSRANLGDGIVLTQTPSVDIRNVSLIGNQRVGLLVDLGSGDASGLSFDSVAVQRSSGSYGALAGSSMGNMFTNDGPAGWDSGLVRDADTIAADTAFMGDVEFFGSLTPAGSDIPEGLAAGMTLPL